MCYLKLKPKYTCEWESNSMYEENFADTPFNPMELSGIAGGMYDYIMYFKSKDSKQKDSENKGEVQKVKKR